MWIVLLGVILVASMVWVIKSNKNEQDTRKYYIDKYSNSNSQVIPFGASSCLGFDLESKKAIFANWQTYRGYNLYENIPFVESNTCGFSDSEPISNIKEFCIVGATDGEPEDLKSLYVYFHAKPRCNGNQVCLEARASLPNKDIDKITKLIESAGLKVSRHRIRINAISWGE